MHDVHLVGIDEHYAQGEVQSWQVKSELLP